MRSAWVVVLGSSARRAWPHPSIAAPERTRHSLGNRSAPSATRATIRIKRVRRHAEAATKDPTARLGRASRFLAQVRHNVVSRAYLTALTSGGTLFFDPLIHHSGGTYNNASGAASKDACTEVEPGFWAPTGSAAPLPCPSSGFRRADVTAFYMQSQVFHCPLKQLSPFIIRRLPQVSWCCIR